MDTQKTVGQAVEGADPHTHHRSLEDLLNAGPHLLRGLVGEGDGEDRPRSCLFHLEQPGDAVYQDLGLATAGSREHQQVARLCGNRLALRVVELVEDMGDVHLDILPKPRQEFGYRVPLMITLR